MSEGNPFGDPEAANPFEVRKTCINLIKFNWKNIIQFQIYYKLLYTFSVSLQY